VFAQLQEKLGECFDPNTQLPTSEELGFDVTQSIFEVGVAQRLEQLAEAIERNQPQEIATLLRTQAEVFLGIAESLNLPGFGTIAKATTAALNHHPDQVMWIAQQALANFREGQAAVLAGDRSQGGHLSQSLQQLANLTTRSLEANSFQNASEEEFSHLVENIWGESSIPDSISDSISDSILESISELTSEPISAYLSHDFDAGTPIAEGMAVGAEEMEIQEAVQEEVQEEADRSFLPSPAITTPIPVSPQKLSQKDLGALPSIVRVNIKHLDHLNYAVGELLTQQNRQLLQSEQLQSAVRMLMARLTHHQQLLNQLHQSSDSLSIDVAEQAQKEKKQRKSGNPPTKIPTSRPTSDQYRSSYLMQALLDDMVQLTETTEAIALFTRQSTQTQEKQRQLLTNTRNALIEARMMPLGEIFGRFSQVLQQLATLHNKQVGLKLQGMDVLIDKAIAEKLYDPLLHLVRNAFDHGIEPIVIRQQQGKPEKGQIEITAHNQGRYLMIEVRDDGKGIDFDQIRHRAVTQWHLSPEQANQLDQTQLIELLLEPGFSTAAQVNDLSGRGIGLDVVRNQLKALQGSVSIQTEPYRGTTFTLQIPLSLTIAPLLVCEAGGQTYALLDDAIEQIVIPRSTQLQEQHGGRTLKWNNGTREQRVPIYPLSSLLNYRTVVYPPQSLQSPVLREGEPVPPIILLRCQDIYLGLEVDRLIGEQELVIRPLGSVIESPEYVHGACILAEGRLALVLDAAMLVQTCCNKMQTSAGSISPVHSPPGNLSNRIPNRGEESSTRSLPSNAQVPLLSQTAGNLPALSDANSDIRILVVEDSITTRQALVLTLQKAGYQVFQSQNGQEAIVQLQQQNPIQLVICDLEMPGMNGFEFLRYAQQTPVLSQTPILILTSRSDQKHRALATQLGATAYMTKPYIEYKLLAVVQELLNQSMLNSMSQ
jgi:chemotaxis protein histidine kinase CheA/CheY-like chemotaxis protein